MNATALWQHGGLRDIHQVRVAYSPRNCSEEPGQVGGAAIWLLALIDHASNTEYNTLTIRSIF